MAVVAVAIIRLALDGQEGRVVAAAAVALMREELAREDKETGAALAQEFLTPVELAVVLVVLALRLAARMEVRGVLD